MTALAVLQSSPQCGINKWITGDWHNCLFSPVANGIGEPLFGLIIGGVTIFGLFLAGSGDVDTPAVVTIMFGGLLTAVLPGGMVQVAFGVAFVGVLAALMSVANRYILGRGI